jgi:hypothetical protein
MNERIKELLNEAEKSVTFLSNSNESKHQIAMQRFAELIVKECASRVDNILREKKHGGGTMGDEIREHFGVE